MFFDRFSGRHSSVVGVLRFLEFDHLRHDGARELSRQFAELAATLLDVLPDDPELVIALRKIREAKDCAVGLKIVSQPKDQTTSRPAS